MWFILAISAAALWGINYSVIEQIFKQKIHPFTLISFELLVGAIIFLSYSFLYNYAQTKHDIHTILKDNKLLLQVIITCLTFHLANVFIFLSIQLKDATLTSVIELSYPLFTILFTWLFFRIFHLNMVSMIGAALILVGCGVLKFADQ